VRSFFWVAGFAVAFVAAEAQARPPSTKATIRLGKMACEVVADGYVVPLQYRIDGPVLLRCRVEIAFKGDFPTTMPLILSLDQPPEDKGPPVHVESRLDLQLASSGTAELALTAPDELNGCMPYVLTFSLGDKKKHWKVDPDCGEG